MNDLLQRHLEPIFRRNFDSRGELGASFSVWKNGEEIVSLHHGWKDRDQKEAWTSDSKVPVWSATKGPSAIATLLALHRAGLSFDAPVSDLWPELKAAKESRLTFVQLLSHQSGLPALSQDNRPDVLNYPAVIRALEIQEPYWPPGKGHGYHPRTIGFLADEVVRRATGGTTLGRFWNDEIAGPLKIDFRIGSLSADWVERTATIYPPRVQSTPEEELPFYRAMAKKGSLAASVFSSPRGIRALSDINKIENLQAGLPALGGVGSAIGLARFYAILAGKGRMDGVEVLPRSVFDAASQLRTSGDDQSFMMPTAFTAGFMRDPIDFQGRKLRTLFGPSLTAFGQPGAGGSHAFADPENGLSFAYVMNQMQTGVLPNRKSLDLVDALYDRLN
ncbi:MAG: serine hydrolase domain-containing protein [Verrucomicrobiota bacterium]